jgi:hypothetical protein
MPQIASLKRLLRISVDSEGCSRPGETVAIGMIDVVSEFEISLMVVSVEDQEVLETVSWHHLM